MMDTKARTFARSERSAAPAPRPSTGWVTRGVVVIIVAITTCSLEGAARIRAGTASQANYNAP